MPPLPKSDALRQRRNKSTTKATLGTAASGAKNKVPDLPKRPGGWHHMLRQWWESVWRSPMASEYLDADMKGGLFQLAYLHQSFWEFADMGVGGTNGMMKIAAEIRLQEVRFGLSPIDRRRLQWEVEKGEQAAERTSSRRKSKSPKKAAAGDPRQMLKIA